MIEKFFQKGLEPETLHNCKFSFIYALHLRDADQSVQAISVVKIEVSEGLGLRPVSSPQKSHDYDNLFWKSRKVHEISLFKALLKIYLSV